MTNVGTLLENIALTASDGHQYVFRNLMVTHWDMAGRPTHARIAYPGEPGRLNGEHPMPAYVSPTWQPPEGAEPAERPEARAFALEQENRELRELVENLISFAALSAGQATARSLGDRDELADAMLAERAKGAAT